MGSDRAQAVAGRWSFNRTISGLPFVPCIEEMARAPTRMGLCLKTMRDDGSNASRSWDILWNGCYPRELRFVVDFKLLAALLRNYRLTPGP